MKKFILNLMMVAYCLFDKEGNLVDVKVDARQLDNLEKIIKELSK